MRALISLILFASALPAHSDDCSKWSASMEDVEGGQAMIARTCSPNGGEMTISCGAPGELYLSFAPVSGDFLPEGNPDFKDQFSIEAGKYKVVKEMVYQAMDGLMALTVSNKDPLADALQNADKITFTSQSPSIPEASFTLSGSKAAIAKVTTACVKS